MSTDSDREPGSSQRLGAPSGVEFSEATSAERATRPEFSPRIRPTCTAEAADAYADAIRPSWEEPSFRTLRRPAAEGSAPPPLLSADEADAYAARIQPSWAPPPAWSASPSMPVMTETSIEQPDRDWVEPDRTRVLRAALIVAGFALLGAAAGALLALAPRLGQPAPAVENTRVSALTAETPAAVAAKPSNSETASLDTIRVRIAAKPARAKILLDGIEVPNPLDGRRLKGGKHRVLIRATGRATRDLTLTFERDEHVRVELDPLVRKPP